MGRKRLSGVALTVTWTTLIGALGGVPRGMGEQPSQPELMGITGFGFRLALTVADGVLAGAPAAASFDLERALPLVRNAGYPLRPIVADPTDRDYRTLRERALKETRKSIDRGRPVIAFDLHIPEFGLILGYDDRAHTLQVSSLMSGQYGETIPEDRWPVPERGGRLIVLLPGGRERVDRSRALRDTLRFAVAYARDGDPGDPTGAVHGLAAFRLWSEALEGGAPIDRAGHARAIQTVQAARYDVARFLRDAVAPAAARAELTEAAAAYDRVALACSRLATLFPYPAGGDLDNAGLRRVAATIVRDAEAREREAVTHLGAGLALF